jgi:hypothetical protein
MPGSCLSPPSVDSPGAGTDERQHRGTLICKEALDGRAAAAKPLLMFARQSNELGGMRRR